MSLTHFSAPSPCSSYSDHKPPSFTQPLPHTLPISKRHAKIKAESHITRPPNAFLLFRSDLWAREKHKANPVERDHRDISRIAAHCWRSLDAANKQKYHERAVKLREAHQARYPEYKYTPSARKVKGKSKAKKVPEEDARCALLASTIMPEVMCATKKDLKADGVFEVHEYSKAEAESLIYQIYGCSIHELKEWYAIFQPQ